MDQDAHGLGDMVNGLTGRIVDAFVEVHRQLGPGYKEQHYQEALAYELGDRGLGVKQQVRVEVSYKGRRLARPLRLDFVVEDLVVVEIKAVEKLLPLHRAQLIRYVKAANLPVGLLANFDAPHMGGQMQRVANTAR